MQAVKQAATTSMARFDFLITLAKARLGSFFHMDVLIIIQTCH